MNLFTRLFSSISIVFLFYFSLSAQPIQNAGFENWTIETLFQDPEGFQTSNFWSYLNTESANVVKTGDSYSGYAARLGTLGGTEDTIPGMLVIGNIGDEGIYGGVPFTDRPDMLKAYIKHDVMTDDTAMILVAFLKLGEAIGEVVGRITGTQTSYYLFEQDVVWYSDEDPDTMLAVISSSNLDNFAYIGSNLYVDSIHFTGSETPFPNGDLENWEDVTLEEPDDWATLNIMMFLTDTISVTKTEDAYEGNYAARIQTVSMQEDEDESLFGFITNGYFGEEGPEGGLAVDLNPHTFTGQYKYLPKESDTALCRVFTYRYDLEGDSTIKVEEQILKLPPAEEYTYFEINMDYNGQPQVDTVNIAFASSNFEDIGGGIPYQGSVLFVDYLVLKYHPVGMGVNNTQSNVSVYPNPFSDRVSIQFKGTYSDIIIYDILGNVVKNWNFNSMNGNQDKIVWDGCNHFGNQLPDGLYFGKINSENSSTTFKVLIRR